MYEIRTIYSTTIQEKGREDNLEWENREIVKKDVVPFLFQISKSKKSEIVRIVDILLLYKEAGIRFILPLLESTEPYAPPKKQE